MIYLIIDTNIWLYLANGLDTLTGKHSDEQHFKLLEELRQLKESNDICIIVNEVIFEEWKRNKEICKIKIEKLKKKLNNPDEHFRELKKYVKSETQTLQNEYIEGIKADIKANEEHIQKVEEFLLNDCIKVEITDKLKTLIFDLSVQKNAPFHNKKNNIADACILFSAREYIKNQPFYLDDSAIFVSNNFDDFTDGKNRDDFHPEIKEIIKPVLISYERILPKALKISKEIIIEIEEYHKHEKWLESVYFSCRTSWCEGHKDFSPWGYLDTRIDVKYKSDELIDPRQLDLFPDMPRLIREKISVGVGTCVVCETLHTECPECGALTYIEDYLDEFECMECFVKLKLIHDSDGGMSLLVNDIYRPEDIEEDKNNS
jgi:hypothetical protein